jgi:cytochrome c556
MGRVRLTAAALLFLALALGLGAQTQVPVLPRLEPVAETHLIMEGLANPNFRGLERNLKEKPTDHQAWVFTRGQALLLAETANLLMLRPPKASQAQPVWFQRAVELRRNATDLAQALAKRDYAASRASLVEVANSCNRCHQSFRVAVEIVPFAPPAAKPAGPGV